MSDVQLSLTQSERECLVGILERVLKETRVEGHRTRAPAYREHVVDQEHLIAALLTKLGQPPKS
jgi:hypothetical protein